MAEIKSTLELIMERTRNLSMTEKEKENIHKKEAAGKINGLIQKYLDDTISVNILKAEIEGSEKTFPECRQIMETALLNHLQPESENPQILKALEQALGIDTKPLREIISQFQKEMDRERSKIIKSTREALKKREFSGSAIIPNPSRDESLQTALRTMTDHFKKQLLPPLRGN